MRRITYIIGIFSFATILSCKSYLEEEPKRLTSIQTVDQLEALINNPATVETNITAGYSTDDTEISQESYSGNVARYNLLYMYYYSLETDIIAGLASDGLWSGEFSKIFKANLVLFYLDKVTGDPAKKADLKADAHFNRAYSNWVLANYYCQPYKPGLNENELGLPLKKTTDYEEPLVRATLKETYDFILADLEEAQKISTDDVPDRLRWRASKKGVSAFLSRFYLFMEDYDKSIQYANEALTSANAQLVDFKTILPGNPTSYTNPAATVQWSELNDWAASDYYYWKELFFTRYTYVATQFFQPSTALVNLYDKTNDLRYKWFVIPNGGRRFSIVTPEAYRYTMFNDGRYLISAPTVAEMHLNKAEALLRKQSPDMAGALTTINLLREKRMNTPAPLVATDVNDALKKVLEERRREIPFVMRWLDIRRFSINSYAGDDVVVTHPFFQVNDGSIDVTKPTTYTLPLGSRRYALPIPEIDINASKNQLEQNKYSN